MFSRILDVVIGLLFIFLVGSLIVSAINEAITRLLAWRSRHLWRALRHLLDVDDASGAKDVRPSRTADARTWTDKVYDHPLIRQLERRTPTDRSRLASIPPRDFAQAFVDVLVPDGNGETSIGAVRAAVRGIEPSALRTSLLAMLNEVDGGVSAFRSSVETWFDDRMKALSRAYRLHAKWLLVGIGIITAVVLNVDALHAGQRLYEDDVLRIALADQASRIVETCEDNDDVQSCVRSELDEFDEPLTLPVGWDTGVDITPITSLGWLLAGVALGQGAPFWFDLLRKAGRLRQ